MPECERARATFESNPLPYLRILGEDAGLEQRHALEELIETMGGTPSHIEELEVFIHAGSDASITCPAY